LDQRMESTELTKYHEVGLRTNCSSCWLTTRCRTVRLNMKLFILLFIVDIKEVYLQSVK